ncbi:MAG: glycoside hydrolase family 2 TIM barrel-domain containing protein [Phycisphaeraceae bacterium]
MLTKHLNTNWTLRAVGDLSDVHESIDLDAIQQAIPATVPGTVHTALLRAGLIPDPYLDRNELLTRWIGQVDWQYRCTFDLPADMLDHEHVGLVCEGLDTIASVELNGQPVGQSHNMHHPHVWPVKPQLRAGENELVVTFASPLKYALAMEAKLGEVPRAGSGNNPSLPHNFIRKNSCNMGWDWGPVATTAGLWKPVYLRVWDAGRIAQVRPLVTAATTDGATVEVHVQLRLSKPATLEATLSHGQQTRIAQRQMVNPGDEEVALTLKIARPELWWPRGHGEQPLYSLNLILVDEDRQELDHWFGRIGLRTVELDRTLDDPADPRIGSAFALKINGRPIFCKGANWIPDDCFLDRACEPHRVRQRIEQAAAAHMNMLRVWGGGIYETDAFYEACDELGIMVWQDFLFACASYVEEEPFRSAVEAEARYNVARLSRHPSLVLWNGCNENLWGYRDWGWQKSGLLKGRTWGPGYYFDLLPRIVKELDPTRPYWAASPWSGDADVDAGIHPNDPDHGNMHVWAGAPHGAGYRRFVPRFASEFGHQGPPTWATLTRAIPRDQRRIDSPAIEHHQKAGGGNAERLHKPLADIFEPPADFEDWHYLTQINQARSIQTGIEWWRSRRPRCMGTLYWQLNDCWPVLSWAAIDGDGRLKPLWFATRRFFAPRLLTIQPAGPIDTPDHDRLVLFVDNETAESWRGQVMFKRIGFDGQALAHAQSNFDVAAYGNTSLPIPPNIAAPHDAASESIVAQIDDAKPGHAPSPGLAGDQPPAPVFWFFDVDRNLRYPLPKFDTDLAQRGTEYHLTVTARSLLRDLCVFADRLDPNATVSEQMITLLPGDSFTFVIESEELLDKDALSRRPVLRCVNDVVVSSSEFRVSSSAACGFAPTQGLPGGID